MTKHQWLSVAQAALVNAGCSPSAADAALENVGLDPQGAEETVAPTNADWQAAFDNGGMRLHPPTQPTNRRTQP